MSRAVRIQPFSQGDLASASDEVRLMTVAAAAQYCGMSTSTYRRHVNCGRLPGPMPHVNRIDRLSIDEAISKIQRKKTNARSTSVRSEIAIWRKTKQLKEASNDD
ncbi:MAG: hypothetical protein ACPG06_00240 [Alphaproteobacteria bacterium]